MLILGGARSEGGGNYYDANKISRVGKCGLETLALELPKLEGNFGWSGKGLHFIEITFFVIKA